jgi:predicted lipoprotein with Yx(FWY)xxD motif
MLFRSRFYATLAVVAALTIVTAAACGDDSTPTKTATNAPAVTKTDTAPLYPSVTGPSPAASTASSPPAASAAAVVKAGTTSKGPALIDAAGLTLYLFDNDTTPGKSACNGGCAATWAALTTTATSVPAVTGAAGQFTIITRDDGGKQVAYNGKPLYRFVADKAAGDTGGDGIGGVWHIAKP